MGVLDFFRKIRKKAEQEPEEASPPVEEPVTEEEGSAPAGTDDSGFAHVWMVELLYRGKPVLNLDRLYSKMQDYTGPVQLQDEEERDGPDESGRDDSRKYSFEPLVFFHDNYRVQYKDGALPAQTCILPPERSPEPAMYEAALQQSWHWPEARQVVGQCRHSLLLTDFGAAGLDYKERLKLFQNALRALLETVPCDAIYWKASGKVVHPEEYLRAVSEGEWLYGAMNVRLYKLEETGGTAPEMLVDTCGLAAMGIPDLQCHFGGLDPNEVATMLIDLAYYLFERGDIIQDGETIGSAESQRWRCEHQHALVEPKRYVIDLDPGEPYYAGKQHHSEQRQSDE
ncbi:DUF4261 domain-containing protein [Paenibacillus sp. J2TS4]|uniref:DUF4261 domain-containing protein n=1 Tax=Paenibacillus sp. J2TS4 TaxID=2807194 RepID=UPI001B0C7F46|nr:DUF4261 domain-containing protein [Paenibacillus sp. J2TS4]GIP33312.1 hypothetical protein J2TS4_25220 [Paenibacillus sp. J2TS4]